MTPSKTIDTDKLNALIEINTLINSNYSDVNALLAYILESAMRLVEGEASSLLLVDSDKKTLRFEVALGPKGLEAKKFVVRMDEGIAGWVVKNNRSLIVNDVANDPRYSPAVQKSTGYETRNMLAVPMRVKNECIGVIEILNKETEAGFTHADLEVIEILANQAAIAYQNAQHYQRSRDEIAILQDQIATDRGYHTLIARSPVILEKLDIVERVAKSDSSVLILGESGVGKELFAEQLHLKSDRAGRPFVRVNCAALPEGLLESELFGHVKGAFTDAVSNR
ncbi:MAG TPA: sigma 54-interacting transcriptional regulator, partial [Treponemataceae bacterium]|nr:sigma 54-interacting transcriptional regulator [Treponemataceae bacterium]